jgi:hypothetical protein
MLLADLEGPGMIRHIWMTFPPAEPQVMRAMWLDVFYDDLEEPSVSAPVMDFFAMPHGRPAAFDSEMISVHEGRGFNSYLPMPFRRRVRIVATNRGDQPIVLFYQVDYTLQELGAEEGYLHVSFRRENPTTLVKDFTIAEGLRGPGRFLGCAVGIRVLDRGAWFGEGELKIYRDGDVEFPTICGTGLEDYVGSAWGMSSYSTRYAGVPLLAPPPDVAAEPSTGLMAEFVTFYRWHVVDPVVFTDDLRVTLQQIGIAGAMGDGEAELALMREHVVAGLGWARPGGDEKANAVFFPEGAPRPASSYALGIVERSDDYCATAYVYCREPQPVPRLDLNSALADIELRDYERPATADD